MSDKETTLKEKFRIALTSTAKVISDDLELDDKSSNKKNSKDKQNFKKKDKLNIKDKI